MKESLLTTRIGIQKPPKISYIIFTTPRSGSTFFCEALNRTKIAGRPDEHFLHWYRSECRPEQIHPMEAPFRMLPPVLQMRRAIRKGTSKNVFGVKVMYPYFSFVETSIRNLTGFQDLPGRDLLESFFPNLHYIHLSRRNKIRQAVSLARALQIGEWKRNAWTPLVQLFQKFQTIPEKKTNELIYDFDKILGLYKEMRLQDEEWESYFKQSGIDPLQIVYEDLVGNFEGTIRTVLSYLDLPIKQETYSSQTLLQRQSDVVNDEWTERFQRDLSRMKPSKSNGEQDS